MKSGQRKSMINVRGCFSESIGKSKCIMEMQYDDFDERTRTQISNKLFEILKVFLDHPTECGCRIGIDYRSYNDNVENYFCRAILSNVLNKSTVLKDGDMFDWKAVYTYIQGIIEEAEYNEVLDILWYINNWINQNFYSYNAIFSEVFNNIFETEYVGYRFVDGKIVAITDKNEIDEIEQACNVPYNGCKSHIEKAVGFLADREHKDYKNCIKESISAVESICQIMVDDEKATLGEAIKKLKDNGIKIHPALETAFSKLFGYTSDEGGIRHAEGLFVSEVSFEEAKFMLVSCSAFVNYLISEYGKIKRD